MNHGHRNARQYSDQYHCSYCNKQWDVNDQEPPPCIKWKTGLNRLDKIRNQLGIMKVNNKSHEIIT